MQKVNPRKPENPKKWYAISVTKGDISLRELSKEIAEISTVSTVDTMAVIESLLQLIPRHVVAGQIVRLGDFGSFCVRLSSQGTDTEKDWKTHLINKANLCFRPGKELKNQLDNVIFAKK